MWIIDRINRKKEVTAERKSVGEVLVQMSPENPQYEVVLKNYGSLIELERGDGFRVSGDTIVKVLASTGMGLLIMHYESTGHVFPTRFYRFMDD